MKIRSLVLLCVFTLLVTSAMMASCTSNDDCPTSREGSRHGNLGARLWERGQLADAEKETREAIRIDGDCSMSGLKGTLFKIIKLSLTVTSERFEQRPLGNRPSKQEKISIFHERPLYPSLYPPLLSLYKNSP
jgi:hypothetical protein